jgi:hypothetical protein
LLRQVAIVAGILILVGLLLPIEKLSHPALAQELPPRPTLTPPEEPDDDDDEEPTPIATATPTLAPTPTVLPTFTPTPAPPSKPAEPTPARMPVTGGQSGDGRMWVALAIGLAVCAIAFRRALWFLLVSRS